MARRTKGILCRIFVFAAVLGPVASTSASLIPEGRDLWFSSSGVLLTRGESGPRLVRRGDILDASGQVVRSNADLLAEFQPRMFLPIGRGLDSLSVMGTGDDQVIYFSTARGFFSNKLGRRIGEGDLLNDQGQLVATNQQLLEALDPRGAGDLGLDGADVRAAADALGGAPEIWFSTQKDFYSRALGASIGAGDVISNRGQLIARNADLLSAFDPQESKSYGLDALHVIDNPDGSTTFWFSTRDEFFSQSLDRIVKESELLSSDGQVVMSEEEFLKVLGRPIIGCFGLDAAALLPVSYTPPKPPPPIPEPATVLLLVAGALPGLLRRGMALWT